jgi:hypothetical protein
MIRTVAAFGSCEANGRRFVNEYATDQPERVTHKPAAFPVTPDRKAISCCRVGFEFLLHDLFLGAKFASYLGVAKPCFRLLDAAHDERHREYQSDDDGDKAYKHLQLCHGLSAFKRSFVFSSLV